MRYKEDTAAYRDQQVDAMPGPDPEMPCGACGVEYRVSHFKRFGQVSNDPEEPCLCPACYRDGAKTTEQRRENNQDIREYLNT